MTKGKSWKRLAGFLAAGLSLALVTTGCGGEKKEAEEKGDTIKIGVNMELTGGVSVYGQSCYNGIKMAVDEINAAGGVNGKKLEIVAYDTKSEPAEAANGAMKLITEDQVKVLIGPATSGASISAQQVATEHKVPMITPSGTAENVTVDNKGDVRKYIFRAPFIDAFQGTVMARFAGEDLQAKTAVIYIDNSSDYSKGQAATFEEVFVQSGGTIVGKESYLQRDVDFKSSLTKIKAMNPDVIYIPGYYQEVALIVKQAREIGVNQPLLGGDGWDSPQMFEVAGAAMTNAFMSNHYSGGDSDPKVKEFEEKYEKKYGAKPEAFAALAYDSTMLVADALRRADSTDTEKITEALAQTQDIELVTGKISFDAFHNPIKSAVIIEYKEGKREFRTKINP
jgi:ABC-type branched-chain amino acid transport systems, periplasmic component